MGHHGPGHEEGDLAQQENGAAPTAVGQGAPSGSPNDAAQDPQGNCTNNRDEKLLLGLGLVGRPNML